jgi:hypothetical protein
VVNNLDTATVVEALTHACGFVEAGRVTTFRACRREKTGGGGEHEVTVEIHDAGPDRQNRYRVVACDEFGRRAAGNGHASLDVALSFVDWWDLDGPRRVTSSDSRPGSHEIACPGVEE